MLADYERKFVEHSATLGNVIALIFFGKHIRLQRMNSFDRIRAELGDDNWLTELFVIVAKVVFIKRSDRFDPAYFVVLNSIEFDVFAV